MRRKLSLLSYSPLGSNEVVQLTEELSKLRTTSAEVHQMLAAVVPQTNREGVSLGDLSLALYHDIKKAGDRLREMLRQPLEERAEGLSDDVLKQLIRQNDRMEREARKFI